MKSALIILACLFFLSFAACPPIDCGCENDDQYGDDSTQWDDDDDSQDDDDIVDDDDDNDTNDDDDVAPLCEEGQTECSTNGLLIIKCQNGNWAVQTDCMADYGKLCENSACVDPWRYASPAFEACDDDPNGTSMSLAAKAAKYDLLSAKLHVHPDHKRIHNVTLGAGFNEANGTWQNVTNWHTGENDGLWTGLYIASQAFRYAVTNDQRALDNLELMLDGMRMGMEITGVDGVFTREYINPGITGMSCPADPNEYIPDVEKDDNQWVKVDTDGTILTYDGAVWVRSTHKVPIEFADFCWLDNVSQDEYAGHMFALGVTWMVVDDPVVKAMAADLLEKVGLHLLDNGMVVRDWDDRLTEHGRLWPLALDDWPGFNAVLGLSYVKMAAEASANTDLH